MKLQLVPARQGIQWVRQGFAVFMKQPMGFAALFAVFLFAVFTLTLLPWVGPLLLVMLLPLGSLGFMVATRQALEGQFPLPRAFLEPLRSGRAQRLAFIKLGLLYAAGTWAVMGLSEVLDGGALSALLEAQASGKASAEATGAALADPMLRVGMLLRMGLLALLSVPFWHAPALVHWGGQTAGKALFFSTVACWRNKGAFLLYSLTWVGLLILFAVLVNLVFALLGRPQLVPLVAMPASLVFSTVFYASLHFTFDDCFRSSPADEAGAPTLVS